ncbi:MAG: riboflavin synthase [Chloroflexia bacterium]|nr:riboflavin synthase [Chloroflexia bacterium]
MFTGIIEEIGSIERISQAGTAPLRIHCRSVLGGTHVGDSIAVNGVCLTVIHLFDDGFMADLQPVTRRLSNLGGLRIGDAVNLERSVAAGDRLGGHFVQGHIDGVARIVSLVGEGPAMVIRLALPPDLLRYVVERGFIAVDGASLTVMRLRPDGAEVSLVDHTQQSITLPQKRPGDQVNVEVDVLAKYVERLLGQSPADDISMDVLRRNGFA